MYTASQITCMIKRHCWQNNSRIVCNVEEVLSILRLQESASQKELEEKLKSLKVNELQLLCKESTTMAVHGQTTGNCHI